jgi:hypothetical protein
MTNPYVLVPGPTVVLELVVDQVTSQIVTGTQQGLQGTQGVQGTQGILGQTGFRGGVQFRFSSNTGQADPTSGFVRFNNSVTSSITEVYISNNSLGGADVSAWYQSWDDSTNTTGKGTLVFQNYFSDSSSYCMFTVTGSPIADVNYYRIPVAFLSGEVFANNTGLTLDFLATGNIGLQGIQGLQGVQGTTGIQGFTGIQGITGSQGTQGIQGIQGIIGSQGTQGLQGTTGIQGLKGNQGDFGGASFYYRFLTKITSSDPLSGNLNVNNVNLSLATFLTIDDEDRFAENISSFIQTIDDSTSDIKGTIKLTEENNTNNFVIYNIIGTHLDDASHFDIPIAYVTGTTTPFSNNTNVIISFLVTGDKGDQGIQGIQGTTGTQGTTGATGAQGTTGATGSQGTTGTQGLVGIQGITGNTGLQGTQGVQGQTGTQGSVGIQGTDGTQGTVGSQGTQGIQGETGIQGTLGLQGTEGPQGVQGIQGETGIQGITGTQGTVGTQGIQGIQGTQGEIGSQGTQGIQGLLGTQGLTGSGTQGIQGVQGQTGPSGGSTRSISFVTSNTNLTTTYDTYLASGQITLTLPSASSNSGSIFYIKNVGVGQVTIALTGSDKIDSNTSLVLRYTNSSLSLVSDGTDWKIF